MNNTEDFITAAIAKHSDKYDYTNVAYQPNQQRHYFIKCAIAIHNTGEFVYNGRNVNNRDNQ